MVDEHNVLAKSSRRVRYHFQAHISDQFALGHFRNHFSDAQTYNITSVDKVTALIVGDFDSSDCGRDIIVQCRSSELQMIYKMHTTYLRI